MASAEPIDVDSLEREIDVESLEVASFSRDGVQRARGAPQMSCNSMPSDEVNYPALEAALVNERFNAFMRVGEVMRTSAEKVANLEAELVKCSKACIQVDAYLDLPPPATVEELRTRDEMRIQLDQIVEAVQTSIPRLVEAGAESEQALQAAKEKVLGRIDDMVDRLTALRAATVDIIPAYEATMQENKKKRAHVAVAVEPLASHLDLFMNRRSEEILSEVEAGKKCN